MKRKEIDNIDYLKKLSYEQRVDDIIFSEYNEKRTEVMLPCIFYKLSSKLWRSVCLITIDNFMICNKPKDDEDKIKTKKTKYIDTNKTHDKLLENGWIWRNIMYSSYYFKDNMIFELEAVDGTLYLDHEGDEEKWCKEIQSCMVEQNNKKKSELGVMTRTSSGYSTKYIDFDNMDINVKKTYNDDIPLDRIDKFINEDTSGLALLYGEPGTGKSTFLKYLVQTYDDTVFTILDSDLLNEISNREMISYFLDNEDSIYIIEDAEKLLSSRENNYNPIISSFLNMSDGILASAIKCKFICTFNTALSNIDKALQRKGRMKIKYEFGKLKYEKAKKINPNVKGDTTVAELFYDTENDFSKKEQRRIGF